MRLFATRLQALKPAHEPFGVPDCRIEFHLNIRSICTGMENPTVIKRRPGWRHLLTM